MATQSFDTVILGAGPAGCNLARLLQPSNHRILLINGAFKSPKVCAGLLSPDAQKLLKRYKIALPPEVFCSPQLRSVRVIDLNRNIVRHYPRSYLNVDRAAFDRFLLDLVPSNVTIIHARCLEITQQNNRYFLRLREQDGAEYFVSSQRLVGADGASSLVRRTLFGQNHIQKYVSIQQTFSAGQTDPYYSCIFDPSTSQSCSWIFFKENAMVFGGAFAPHGCRAAFEAQKRRLISSGLIDPTNFDTPISKEACLVSRPHFAHGVFLGTETAFLIGEAAGFISPTSFEGISFALASGEALAKAINASITPKRVLSRYRRKTRILRAKIKCKCIKRPWMYHPLLRTLVMKSRIGTTKEK